MADDALDALFITWRDEADYLIDLIAICPTALCDQAEPNPQSDSMAEGLSAFAIDHQQCRDTSPCRTILDLVQRGHVREAERIAERLVL